MACGPAGCGEDAIAAGYVDLGRAGWQTDSRQGAVGDLLERRAQGLVRLRLLQQACPCAHRLGFDPVEQLGQQGHGDPHGAAIEHLPGEHIDAHAQR